MIKCAFIISHDYNHCIKDPISFSSRYFCSLNPVHKLKTKLTIILIERNIGLSFFKPLQIIGWWTENNLP